MVNASSSPTIEVFVTDQSFDNTANPLLTLFQEQSGQIASLNTKVLSYFNTPFMWTDKRAANSRDVNWTPASTAMLIVDQAQFSSFVTVAQSMSANARAGVFKLVDELLFDYGPLRTREEIEALLVGDSQIGPIYVPQSFSVSSVIETDTVYTGNTTSQVSVPAWAEFSLTLPQGQSTTTVVMRVYASADSWLNNYSISTITKIIPPLPYDKILTASLTNTSDNIFSTASLTASLSYSTTQNTLGSVAVSGVIKYMAVITDGINQIQMPFNILYKGRVPTMYEIRTAMKQVLLSSGVGNETLWKDRIPSVFIKGRFYIVPLWDRTLTKADQTIYPNICRYTQFEQLAEKILGSLGYGDLKPYMDVLSLYYDHMTAVAVPDLSGVVDIAYFSSFVPDYQSHSPVSEQFQYMVQRTRNFATEVNAILAVAADQAEDSSYVVNKEGALEFYSFTIDAYEICVISKENYLSILEQTV